MYMYTMHIHVIMLYTVYIYMYMCKQILFSHIENMYLIHLRKQRINIIIHATQLILIHAYTHTDILFLALRQSPLTYLPQLHVHTCTCTIRVSVSVS